MCLDPPDTETVTADVVPGGIYFEATLVTKSSALGCFVVVQCNRSTPDHYYALPQDEDSLRVSDLIRVPPVETPCTIVVYDLQQKGLPNQLPAIEVDQVYIIKSGILTLIVIVYGFSVTLYM